MAFSIPGQTNLLTAPSSRARIKRQAGGVELVVYVSIEAQSESGFVRVRVPPSETLWVNVDRLELWIDAPGVFNETEREIAHMFRTPIGTVPQTWLYRTLKDTQATIPLQPSQFFKAITSPAVRNFSDGANWLLVTPMEYVVGDGPTVITVPKGFVTDFASIPKAFRWLLGPTGRYSGASVLHDYLYWYQQCRRVEADRLYHRAMVESGVSLGMSDAMFLVLHFAGERAWNANKRDRRQGLVRTIPAPFDSVPPLLTWNEYRRKLAAKRVTDGQAGNVPSEACRLGSRLVK